MAISAALIGIPDTDVAFLRNEGGGIGVLIPILAHGLVVFVLRPEIGGLRLIYRQPVGYVVIIPEAEADKLNALPLEFMRIGHRVRDGFVQPFFRNFL